MERLLADDRPIVIVVGDYYIFGETDNTMEVHRLIREYSINSREDLSDTCSSTRTKTDSYLNLDLTYLPSSIALALKDLVPILTTGKKQVRSC